MVENPPATVDVRDTGSIPVLGRSSGGGRGNPLPCSCLWTEKPGQATVHGVAKGRAGVKSQPARMHSAWNSA